MRKNRVFDKNPVSDLAERYLNEYGCKPALKKHSGE
jgi:hypothetical protein